MVKNQLDYYYITLHGGTTTITIGDKVIPILGVFLPNNDLYEIISGKKIVENTDNKPYNGLSYDSITQVNKKDIKYIEKIIFGMTIKEKEEYQTIMYNMEEKAKLADYFKDSFGLGDIMCRKLQYKAKRKRQEY